jgi:hypothetical protein
MELRLDENENHYHKWLKMIFILVLSVLGALDFRGVPLSGSG